MASWIDHHTDGLLRLVGRQFGADLDRVRDGLVEIIDLDVEVHRHLAWSRSSTSMSRCIDICGWPCTVGHTGRA